MKETPNIDASLEAITIAPSNEVATSVSTQPAPAVAPKAPKASKVEFLAVTAEGGTANPATLVFKAEASAGDRSPLTAEEQVALVQHEAVITRGLASFIEVGKALQEIQARRLYRLQYSSFEAYLAERWNFKRAQAFRLITASLIARDMSPIGDSPLPANESQTRKLKGLSPEQKAAAMNRAKALAGGEAITTAHVETAVGEIKGSESGGTAKPKKPNSPVTPPAAPAAPLTAEPPAATDLVGSLVYGTFAGTPKGLQEVLTALRDGRKAVEAERSYDAAISLLARLETALEALVPMARYQSVTVITDEVTAGEAVAA